MVEVKNLSFSYLDLTSVLSDISFSVPDGQIVALLGANGTGKTTLLKLLAGLMVAGKEQGEILIDGRPPVKCFGEIAYISEAGTYFGDLTPKTYGDFLQDLFPGFDREYYNMLTKFFKLRENETIKKMSKGQKAKVEIAAGMAKRTPYIIMDEPFVGKDMFTREDFMQALSGTLSGKETIFITTHEIDEIENFVDRVIILKDNEIGGNKTVDALRAENKTLQEYMKEIMGYEDNSFYEMMSKKEEKEK